MSESEVIQLSTPKSATHIVGWRGKTPVFMKDLQSRIHLWRQHLAGFTGKYFALYMNDSLEFISVLIAALQENKIVFLPSNVLPATCESLKPSVNGFLGEFPKEYSPIVLAETHTEFFFDDNNILTVPQSSEVVVYTSGSTGEPQAIPKRMHQLQAEAKMLAQLFSTQCEENTDVVSTVSHQHIYGLLFKVFWPLYSGRPIHAISLNFPEEIIAASVTPKSILVSSPAHLKRFTESPVWIRASHRIGTIFSGGSPLDKATILKTEELLGIIPIEVYGSSETGGIASRQRSLSSDDSWTPFLDVEWRIHAENKVIEIRSPYLYDSNWLSMADQVIHAGDNRFLLYGRTDRIVKVEEKRISLTSIEKNLTISPLVIECKVIVVNMEKTKRQRFAAFVKLSPDGNQFLQNFGKLALNRTLRETLIPCCERIAIPKIWRYLEEFPVNMLGKTTYTELKILLDEPSIPVRRDSECVLPAIHLVEQTPLTCQLELKIPANLIYFNGHFPETPILPGVVQINYAILLGRRYFDLPPVFQGMQTLKFQQIIPPDTSVHLSLRFDPETSTLTFCYFSDIGQHASGKILFCSP